MGERDHWRQLWATFSVEDHCRAGAFVAEVLLYDKLIIPVPPTVKDGLEPEIAAREWQRWSCEGWDPDRQRTILAILGNCALQVPWTAERRAEWKLELDRSFTRLGYLATGSVLQQFAPAMARPVIGVSQYHSLAQLAEQGIRPLSPEEKHPAGTLLAVLGHELLVPDDPRREGDDFAILRQAVKVAQHPDYQEKRRLLYGWQQDFINSDGLTDATSIRTAVKKMEKLVDDLKTATLQQKEWKWAKRLLSFLSPASEIADLLLPGFSAVSKATGALISAGKYVTEEGSAAHGSIGSSVMAASLVLDAQEKLANE
jgi:hypothetical protein